MSARIFIVEDQRLIAADLERTLGRFGYDVVGSVAAGAEAVAQVLARPPDLILMDIRLRGPMDGIEAATRIRARLDVPVVYLTAYADEETVMRARGTAPFGYVVKPFNERELRAAVEVALYKHRTDRELAEERAERRAAEEFKQLVEGVKDYAIFMLDAAGRISSWNGGAERLTGYTREEILGAPLATLYTPDAVQAQHPSRELDIARRDGRYSDQGWRVRKEGARFWADVTMTAVDREGERPSYALLLRDSSERKRTEDALRGRDEHLQLLADASRLLAESLDYDATFAGLAKLIVPKLADWFSVELLSADGERVPVALAHNDPTKVELAKELRRRYPARHDAAHGLAQVLRTGAPELFTEVSEELLRKSTYDASHYELVRTLGVGSAMVLPLETRGRVLGGMTLVAERYGRYREGDLVLAQELARRLAVALENARLYQEAQEAVEKAHFAIAARDEFLQIAAHELKTPLTPLQLQLDSLARAVANHDPPSERFRDKLQLATRQTLRLTRLVASLVDVSRITGGRLTLELEACDMASMVRRVAERYRNGGATPIVVDASDPIYGHWDRPRVEQIVSNLLANAVKYGAGQPVTVSASARNGSASVTVTDHGIGIDEEALERIFGRFERAVSLRHFGGLGLGLFVARKLAEAHGGTIVAESQPGLGSTFTVMLPIDAAAPPMDPPAGQREERA